MDNLKLAKRINSLTEKINDNGNVAIIHFDFNSFSEAEKTLFRKSEQDRKRVSTNRKRRYFT